MDPLAPLPQSTLRDYGRTLKRRRSVVLIAMLATLIPAVLISLLKDPVYRAEAEMLLTPAAADNVFATSAGAASPERIAENAIRVLEGRSVRERVSANLGIDGEAPSVVGIADGEADVIIVRVEAGDADVAASLADGYVQAYIDTQRDLSVQRFDDASTQLQVQIDQLGERMSELDATIAERVAARTASVSALRAQIRDIETLRTTNIIRLSEIEADLSDITVAETTERRDLQAAVAAFDIEIADLETSIGDLEQENDSELERSRQALFDQESEFIQRLDELQVDSALASGEATLLAPAEPPESPSSPRPVLAAILALFAGFIIGAVAALIIEYLDDSIVGPADFAKLGDAPALLAAVPDESSPDHRPIALSNPETYAVESYRTLRTNVQFLGIDRRMQVLEVTSAVPGEGKSTTAANLAVVLAQTGRSVVLIDADLRKPTVHRAFDVARTYGLTTNLAGENIDLTLQRVGDQFDVLVAGPIPPNPSELLSSRQMGALLNQLRERYDYIVVDAAPVLAVSDALALAQFVDGVLVVVQSGRVPAPRVRNALEALEKVSAPVVGVVLNRADPRKADLESYQYGATYGQVYGAEKITPPVRVPQ